MLVVGAVEPEVMPWLRAAGHAPQAVPGADEALEMLREAPVDLVIVDRDPGGLDAAGVCRALRQVSELSEPWLLAITVAARGKGADAALDAGADDYLHRPFTRGELLARSRAGLRAAQQRADDTLVRALMVNVPGAIYRSAWHAGPHAGADQRRDRADLGLSGGELHRQLQADAAEHRPPARPQAGACARSPR